MNKLNTLNILYKDENLIFVEKPVGVSSESELPALIKETIGLEAFPVHRLDVPVGGMMVFALNKNYSNILSQKIANNTDFEKNYLAVAEGDFVNKEGQFVDLLFKDSRKNKSFVVKKMRKGVREAKLNYKVLSSCEYKNKTLNLVLVTLYTGRSHQIRVQFASRKHFLVGDGKYGSKINGNIALFSQRIKTCDLDFSLPKPKGFPWDCFT